MNVKDFYDLAPGSKVHYIFDNPETDPELYVWTIKKKYFDGSVMIENELFNPRILEQEEVISKLEVIRDIENIKTNSKKRKFLVIWTNKDDVEVRDIIELDENQKANCKTFALLIDSKLSHYNDYYCNEYQIKCWSLIEE